MLIAVRSCPGGNFFHFSVLSLTSIQVLSAVFPEMYFKSLYQRCDYYFLLWINCTEKATCRGSRSRCRLCRLDVVRFLLRSTAGYVIGYGVDFRGVPDYSIDFPLMHKSPVMIKNIQFMILFLPCCPFNTRFPAFPGET